MGDFEEVERLQAGIRTGPVYALAFSPDGATLPAAQAPVVDGPPAEIGTPMTAAGPVYARVQPGRRHADRRRCGRAAWTWPPGGLLAGACAIADQSLTRQQWADYAGTQPFQQVCSAS